MKLTFGGAAVGEHEVEIFDVLLFGRHLDRQPSALIRWLEWLLLVGGEILDGARQRMEVGKYHPSTRDKVKVNMSGI